jgi:hypothetical protein
MAVAEFTARMPDLFLELESGDTYRCFSKIQQYTQTPLFASTDFKRPGGLRQAQFSRFFGVDRNRQ